MPLSALTGSRVRERRLALGLRQADVARAAGISAAYLNLIEHGRRRVTGDVLVRLATVLGIESAELEQGSEGALAEVLRTAAAAEPEAAAELERIEEFIGRYPGWARLSGGLQRRIGQLEQAVAALNDRIAHDPHLSLSLHEVLSAVSSVRSTAAILAETEDIEPEWRARFHANLHHDSERLATGAEALVAYLDGSDRTEMPGAVSPQEELDDWLAARGWYLPELEAPGDEVDLSALASVAARDLATVWVARMRADMAMLPLPRLEAALAEWGPDPVLIGTRTGAGVLVAMRRLALRPGSDLGLVIADAAGALVFRKPVPGFVPPRFGAACALWPLFEALARPMMPVLAEIEMAGRRRARFAARAWGEASWPEGFGGVEVRQAAMLLSPVPDAGGSVRRVGATCRICPEPGCPARREAPIVSEVTGLRG
ncbi:MAG: XRE family transcriptional regulator [Rhodobacterales bacterium 65-51]|uniref:helix-turn-helix domain-containing protein n=1 Tax=uncultured Gemmobacter sp. TaxID=1095917 RepID=UPI000966F66B|nr:XRE family transcriptional regulator [uncultured Gemmobacter sp.]OJY29016.1 MAG: XRE family transcriptional regulator [Rhodobacterales bacterium 65-51]